MKTNKEFRDDLAKQLWHKYKERNNNLKQIDQLPISQQLKDEAKKEIMENFSKEYGEIKNQPQFAKAQKTHAEEIKAKHSVNKTKKEKEAIQVEYGKKIAKIDEEISTKEAEYNKAVVAHRTTGGIQTEIDDNFENIKGYVMSAEKVDKGIAEMLINKGYYPFVINNIEKFEGLDRKFLAESALNNGWHTLIAANLNKFEGLGLDYKEIAKKLIEEDNYNILIKNLHNFKSLDSEIAINLVDHGYIQNLVENLSSFTKLDKNVSALLIEKGYRNVVNDNIDRFKKMNIHDVEKSVVNKLYVKQLNMVYIDGFNAIDKTINDWSLIYDNNIIAEVLMDNKSYGLLEGKLDILNIDKEKSDEIRKEIKSYLHDYINEPYPDNSLTAWGSGSRKAPTIPLEDEENSGYHR